MAPNSWLAPARVILNNEVQSSDAATKVVKLPLSNYLHTLFVKVKCTNGATSALDQDISDVVDKIEVIANGSDVLYSLTPQEIKRWALWMTGLNIPQARNHRPNAVQEMTFPIMFGRMPFDPNFYLPCARLSDLELRVTYSPTIAATSFVTGTVTIGVFAILSMGNPPDTYLGTICTKTLRAFTSLATGDDQTLVPRGNLLRQLMVYAYEAAIEDGVDVTTVQFDLNNNERVVVNSSWNDLNDVNKFNNWVQHEESIRGYTKDNDTIATDVARIVGVKAESEISDVLATDLTYLRKVDAVAGDTITICGSLAKLTAGTEDLTTDATLGNTGITVVGEGLSHAVVVDFSQNGETQLLNTSDYDQVRVTLTQGGAGADVRISSQEVRSL